MIKVNLDNTKLTQKDIDSTKDVVKKAHDFLTKENGEGSEWLGWKTWPVDYPKDELKAIKNQIAGWDKDGVETLIVIGIGGSYLGIRAAIEFINGAVNNTKKEVIYVGTNMSPDYLNSVIENIKDKHWAINVISKSGTTLEPAVSFRIFRKLLEEKHGAKAKDYIAAVAGGSDESTLYRIAKKEGYATYIIPDNIGGRYSGTTPVGMVAMEFMGIDVAEVLAGSAEAMKDLDKFDLEENPAYKYSAARYLLSKEKPVELFSSYAPRMAFLNEWLKQLNGESEGKDEKGTFPASVTNSADLHSLGQFIQQGNKMLFETLIKIEKPNTKLVLPKSESNDDNLNFLAGKDLNWVNEQAITGVVKAHFEDAKVDNIVITAPDYSAKTLGYIYYFFFISVAMSCYMIDIHPFNQPGVEIYKSYMKELLNK